MITPYHGELVNRLLPQADIDKWMSDLPQLSLTLSQRQLCDVECILCGAFSPLTGFMSEQDYRRCVHEMRLVNDVIWPIPIVLDISLDMARSINDESHLLLRDNEGFAIAVLEISDQWRPNKAEEAKLIYETDSSLHPGVHYLKHETHDIYLGGKIYGLHAPHHYDFPHLRHTPQQLREEFSKRNWSKVIAFQTRNPMHKAHFSLSLGSAKAAQANLLIHPVIGQTIANDIDPFTRVRCYEKILPYYPEQTTLLSLCPIAMRMAGPREAIWHAIIRRNYGCSHIIIGRDHAGVKIEGKNVYAEDAAQLAYQQVQENIGVEAINCEPMVCVSSTKTYLPISQVSKPEEILSLSGTELRQHLIDGVDIPEWYSHPEIIEELKKAIPAKSSQGFTLFFTGLPSSGKSTLAKAMSIKLNEVGGRNVTLIDGDVIRNLISSELGFSKADRELNLKRICYIAKEVTKHHGIAICSAIAPYMATRQKIRRTVNSVGGYIQIYVSTPLEVCEQRDGKGLYRQARKGILQNFTGISDPYEVPQHTELTFDMSAMETEDAVQEILLYLESQGYI